MTYEKALKIYSQPNGHTKEELTQCLDILNELMQPVVLHRLQFFCIQDAIKRLEGSENYRLR
jgi:hypothetical protein